MERSPGIGCETTEASNPLHLSEVDPRADRGIIQGPPLTEGRSTESACPDRGRPQPRERVPSEIAVFPERPLPRL